jgi:hypothetical protein
VSPARPKAIANGKAEVWDLEAEAAKNAAANEAANRPFTFTYKGHTYEIPPMAEWSMEALELVGAGDFGNALPELLGEDTYRQMRDNGLKLGQLTTLFDKVAEMGGMVNLGNSRQPPPPGLTRR